MTDDSRGEPTPELRDAAQAILDALEPLADLYLSEPTQIARRNVLRPLVTR